MSEGDQVTRGERGPKGDHGQGGDVGLTGDVGERGDRGQKGERGDTGAEGKSTLWSRNVSISFLLLTIVFVLILTAFGWVVAENRDHLSRIEAQQQQIEEQRDANRANFARADFQLCRAVETLKAQNRADALEAYARLDRTLELLGRERTPEVEAFAREVRDLDLERNKKADCKELPSSP